MIQAVLYCKDHPKEPLRRVNLCVQMNTHLTTAVNLLMCDKCRMIKITKKELNEWFKENV